MSETTYKDFIIKPKRDFGQYGYLIDGKMVKEGWVVTDHRNVNVMPGATWFQTIEQSKLAIDVLLEYGEDDFWTGWNKEKLNILKKELVKEGKISDNKEKEINSNPKMAKLIEEKKELNKEHESIENKKEKLEKKIKEQFIEIGINSAQRYPSFQHKTYEWDEETNIYDHVLDEIKQHSPLRLLRNGDIEDAVQALIDRAVNKCPELVELKNRHDIIDKRIDKIRDEERELDKTLRAGFQSKVYDIRGEISKIKQQLANPKKFSEQQKRQSKRDEARNKLKDPKVLDTIYKKLYIVIPKRKSKVKVKE